MKKTLTYSFFLVFIAACLHAQPLAVDKTALSFSAQSNGTVSAAQTLNITSNPGSQSFGLLLNPANSWLKVNPSQGTTPSAVTVSADPIGLNPGTYSGQITVFGGSTPFPVVQVTFVVGTIGVSPGSVSFAYQQGATLPNAQTLTLSGTATFNATATTTEGGAWLVVTPTSGTSPGTATVSLNSTVVPGLAAKAYNGKITITPTSGSALTPVEVPVTLTVTAAPPVTVNPATVTLNYQVGSTSPTNVPQQTATLSTTGASAVSFGLMASVDPNPSGAIWVTATPTGGTIPANGSTQVTIGYDTTKNLPSSPITYNGKVTVFTPSGVPTQQDITVRLLVSNAALLSVPSATLAFNYQLGGAAPSARTVTATSTAVAAGSTTGQMQLAISAATTAGGNWLTVPATGLTGTPFSISANPAGLAPGTYSGTVTVTGTGAGNGPQTIPVTLTVSNDPLLTATVNGCSAGQSCTLIFPVQVGQTAPQPQTVRVSSTTGAALTYTATASSSTCGSTWLVLGSGTTGTTDGTFTAAVNPAGIAAGSSCDGSISISAVNPASGAAAPNSPITIPVKMYVSNGPLLSVSPLTLTFTGQVSGLTPPAQQITINSTSPSEQLNYTVTTATASGGSSWLIAGPTSGSTASGSNVVTVIVQPGLLSPGTYTGTITVTATTAAGGAVADSPIVIPVTFTVNAGVLSVAPATLTFNQTVGGALPAAQTIAVTNAVTNSGALGWTATVSTGGVGNWLAISPASGSTPGSISVTANAGGLTPGTYNGTVTVTATTPFSGGSPATVNVQLVVAPGTISAAPTSLNFTQVVGGTSPANQTISVSGTPGAINFSVTAAAANGGWLSAAPATGSTPGTVTVSVNGGSLAAGVYNGTVTIAAAGGATGSPLSVPVTLTVVQPQQVTATPNTVTFNHTLGNPNPAAQTVQLQASGGATAFTATTSVSGGGTWLSVTPTSGTTPATLSIAVNPTGLAAGNYTGTISITSPTSLTPVAASITVNLTVVVTVPPAVTAVLNAASYVPGAIAAGENVTIFGTNLGPAELAKGVLNAAGNVATILAETQVTFDGIAAPIIYASGTQTSVMAPYEIAGRPTATLRVIYKGVQSAALVVNVAAAAPGIYTLNQAGSGPGAILNQNFSLNAANNAAAKLSVVSIYMTGEGVTSPVPANGAIAPLNGTGLFKTTLPVTATVGGVSARVLYYGSAPGIVYGAMQVNVEIPATAPSGASVPIQIQVGSTPTQNNVTVAVQ